jgi:hypothetical protein
MLGAFKLNRRIRNRTSGGVGGRGRQRPLLPDAAHPPEALEAQARTIDPTVGEILTRSIRSVCEAKKSLPRVGACLIRGAFHRYQYAADSEFCCETPCQRRCSMFS